MKETKIMKAFEQYIKEYDMTKGNVKAMYLHSIKMMELCKNIAASLEVFNDEELIVCGLIGLFHGLGMFSNKNKNCIIENEASDITKETLEIIFNKNNLIRQITEDTTYDEIIKIAIYCQNKPGLPQGLDKKIINYCKVIKDANVIERFRLVTNYPYLDMNIDNYPNDNIYNEFKKFKVISSKSSNNDADTILEVMSSIFGIYYKYSYTILKSESSVDKLINSLNIEDKGINKFFTQIASVLKVYIDRKISS